MDTALLALVALACPLGMGLCMWMMARGMRSHAKDGDAERAASVSDLRREQEQIAARIEELERSGASERDLAPR
jgi:hypothetical protein